MKEEKKDLGDNKKANVAKLIFIVKATIFIIVLIAVVTIIYYLGRATFDYVDFTLTNLINSIAAPILITPFIFILLSILIFIASTAFEARHEKGRVSLKLKNEGKENNTSGELSAQDTSVSSENNKVEGEDYKKIYQAVEKELKEGLGEKFIEEVKGAIKKQIEVSFIEESFSGAIDNLHKNINNIRVYINLNLFFGIAISGLAIGMLAYSIFSLPHVTSSDFWLNFTSRLAVSLSIQLLALFFLKLYKNNLVEIKYIQNEITNLESKKIAALMSSDFKEDNRINFVSHLMETERNFVLDKDKTTVQLEQMKLEGKDSDSYLKIINRLISSKKDGADEKN